MNTTSDSSTTLEPKRHFLVIASASRGARFFVKKAIQRGHRVTALYRARDDAAAQERMEMLLSNTRLTAGGLPQADVPEKLEARALNILEPQTYRDLLNNELSIDSVCCFVGVVGVRRMMSQSERLYTRTIGALIEGMRASRWVEFLYHGSSGLEGPPGQARAELPANFHPKWILNLGLKIPAAQDCFESESLLANAALEGMKFTVFRPAWLTTGPAKRHYGFCFDTTSMEDGLFPLRDAKTTIGREDVAEEILRVVTLPHDERARWFGRGVYLADKKSSLRD